MSESREAPTQSTQSSTTEPEKVDINAYGVPVSKNAGKIGSRIGKLVRIHVPISYESWDKVSPKIKNDVWVALLAMANPEKEITRREVWEKTHTKKDGSLSDSTSPYFDKIAKAKEAIEDGVEEELLLDEDILSQVFGKDKRGRTRSIGTKISRTQVKASKIARKQIKTAQNMEDRMTSVEGTLKTLVELIKGNYEKQILDNASNEGGSNACHDATKIQPDNDIGNRHNSFDSVSLKCEILNFNLEVIATGTVCRGSLGAIIHGKVVPPTYKKLVVDSILVPDESTTKQNHPLVTTFEEVGVGGFVCHSKNLLRYL